MVAGETVKAWLTANRARRKAITDFMIVVVFVFVLLFILPAAFGAIFAALVWFNLGTLVRLLGASGERERLAVNFMAVILPSLPILLIGVVGGAILRAHGDARR